VSVAKPDQSEDGRQDLEDGKETKASASRRPNDTPEMKLPVFAGIQGETADATMSQLHEADQQQEPLGGPSRLLARQERGASGPHERIFRPDVARARRFPGWRRRRVGPDRRRRPGGVGGLTQRPKRLAASSARQAEVALAFLDQDRHFAVG